MSVSVCVCLSAIIPSELHVQPSPKNLCVFTYGRGSVLIWRRSDTSRISGFTDGVIFAHKPRLLDRRRRQAEAVRFTRSLGHGA